MCMQQKQSTHKWGAECMGLLWQDAGCTAHLPSGLVESLNMEPSFDSLKSFMGGVVEQATSGSADAQLACFGREDGVCECGSVCVCVPLSFSFSLCFSCSLSPPLSLHLPLTAHLPSGLVESLNMEPSFDTLKDFMGGVVEQAASGSADAQLACFGREDGVCVYALSLSLLLYISLCVCARKRLCLSHPPSALWSHSTWSRPLSPSRTSWAESSSRGPAGAQTHSLRASGGRMVCVSVCVCPVP